MSLSNVEIKAKVRNLDNICKLAEELSGGPPTLLDQDDTFYKVEAGRLKMRFNGDSSATLVRYDRDDKEGPKLSNYELLEFAPAEIAKAKLLDEMLVKSIGTRGRVVKKRKLYMVGQTRVHIDCVEGLGDFMELEVVMRKDQTLEDGQKIATELQRKLKVLDEDLIECAYVDML